MNNSQVLNGLDELYEMVKSVRRYATILVNLNHEDAIKLDSSDWQACISDIETSLTLIERSIASEASEL